MSDYSIWALEYAEAPGFPESKLLYYSESEARRRLAYNYILLKGADHLALVDVGFDPVRQADLANGSGVTTAWAPDKVLKEAGVAPGDVDTVLLTHAHFDHMGNLDAFPNARFYLQERELSRWLWAASAGSELGFLMYATDPEDLTRAARLAAEGRLELLDGDVSDLMPGIDVRCAPDTHTFASMWLIVRGEKPADTFVIAGDIAYVYENLEGTNGSGMMVPIALGTGSQTNMLLAYREMLSCCGGRPRNVIPMHESQLPTQFPSRLNGAGLAVTEVRLADRESSRV